MTEVLWALGVAMASVLASVMVTILVLVRLPADAFSEYRHGWPKSLPRRILRVGLNLVGVVLILIGVVLTVPGVPGQGILTILLGLLLVDVPGRKALLRRILGRPVIREGIDRLRARFGRSPFTW